MKSMIWQGTLRLLFAAAILSVMLLYTTSASPFGSPDLQSVPYLAVCVVMLAVIVFLAELHHRKK